MRMWQRAAASLAVLALAALLAQSVSCLSIASWLPAAALLHMPGAAAALWRAVPGPAVPAAQPAAPANPAAAAPAPDILPLPSPAPTEAPPAATPMPSPTAVPAATIVPAGAGPVEALHYSAAAGSVTLPAGSISNQTAHTDDELAAIVRGAAPAFAVELNSPEPQVLILHTHATETYQPHDALWYDPAFTARTQDTDRNMCAVGARMAQVLNDAGICTLHDMTLHDSPSYTESYARSAATARAYLERYPSIKVILDVHRDAIEADGARIKPLTTVAGDDCAQVMLIAGCDNGAAVPLPDWQKNLCFAAAWETEMETLYPGLTRPVLCGYRFYNQDLTTGSLLIEVGGHANTLPEALRAGEYAARALAALLGGGS